MGNSPSGPHLLVNGNYSSYDIKLGKAATIISVTKNEEFYDGNSSWDLVYNVDGIICRLSIAKNTDRGDDTLVINVMEYCVIISITVKNEKEAGLLCRINPKFSPWYLAKHSTKHGESSRDDIQTYSLPYAYGTRKGLLITQKKKKSHEEGGYMVTIAHYYVNTASDGNTGTSEVDLGFSVVVKIGLHNGRLDFGVDGPVEHPSSALLYMIEEVIRTATWNPSACPHCKNIQSQRRRRLSESEDSEAPFPAPPRYGGSQNTANMGRFNGDANGSIIRAKEVKFSKENYFLKWWK